MTALRFAVIPTHDRPTDFQDCLEAIAPQVDHVFVISHRAPYMPAPAWGAHCTIVPYDYRLPNISEMWNMGIDRAAILAQGDPYYVAVLNDDAIAPLDWFDRVTTAMTSEFPGGAAAGCVRRATDPRMAGYAFILDGTRGLRADEQFQWWWGDVDLQQQAMRSGGIAYAEGPDVEHRHPNSTTVGVLAEIAGEDGKRFEAKWGRVRA